MKSGALVGLVYVAGSLALPLLAGDDISHAAEMTSYAVAPVSITAAISTGIRNRRLARQAAPATR